MTSLHGPTTNAAALLPSPLPAAPPQPSPFSRLYRVFQGQICLFHCRNDAIPPASVPQSSTFCGDVPGARDVRPSSSLFTSTALAISLVGTSPPSVSSPFVDLRSCSHRERPEAGPVRLTRFVDMPLENYYASSWHGIGRSVEYVGHTSSRVEGASVWSVWPQVDCWRCDGQAPTIAVWCVVSRREPHAFFSRSWQALIIVPPTVTIDSHFRLFNSPIGGPCPPSPQQVTCLRPHGLFSFLSLFPMMRSLHFVVSCVSWLTCAMVTLTVASLDVSVSFSTSFSHGAQWPSSYGPSTSATTHRTCSSA